jgi:hypothetical protein
MESSSMILILIVLDIFICIGIAYEADDRGHGFVIPFIMSIIASPLIGAILYSPYKPGYQNNVISVQPSIAIPEPNWSTEQIKLKEKYERGEITMTQYMEEWNKLNTFR